MTKVELRELQNGKSLLDCALELHMMVIGSSDYDGARVQQLLFILKSALRIWDTMETSTYDFDESVRNVIKQAILEYEIYSEIKGD